MNNSGRSLFKSFHDAFAGLQYLFKSQRNAKIHAGIALPVVFIGLWLNLSYLDFAILVLTIGIVWMAEAFNTAIETAVDLCTLEIHPLAKISKDVSAAAVLITALMSVIVGLIVLGRPLLEKITGLLKL